MMKDLEKILENFDAKNYNMEDFEKLSLDSLEQVAGGSEEYKYGPGIRNAAAGVLIINIWTMKNEGLTYEEALVKYRHYDPYMEQFVRDHWNLLPKGDIDVDLIKRMIVEEGLGS